MAARPRITSPVPTTRVYSGECWGSLSKNAPPPPEGKLRTLRASISSLLRAVLTGLLRKCLPASREEEEEEEEAEKATQAALPFLKREGNSPQSVIIEAGGESTPFPFRIND